jgi:hypothetical protein
LLDWAGLWVTRNANGTDTWKVLSYGDDATEPMISDPRSFLIAVRHGNTGYLALPGSVTLPPGTVSYRGGEPRPVASPTVAVGAQAGSGATASMQAGSTDEAGIVTITTGTGVSSGHLATVTFAAAQARAKPVVILSPGNGPAANDLWAVYVDRATLSGTAFQIRSHVNPTVQAYELFYQCKGA